MIKRSDQGTVLGELRKRIENGVLASSRPFPTEREVAEEFGIGRGMVRTVIEELVQSGHVDREPNCRPRVRGQKTLAPAEAPTNRGRIAVWMQEDLQDIGMTLILKGIRKAAGAHGRQLIVSTPPSHDLRDVREWSKGFLRSARADHGVDGIILWASDDPELTPIYQSLLDEGIQMVCLDRDPPESIEVDVVAVDHFRGARSATQHLLRLGHRRIAMMSNDDRVSSVRDRVSGYFAALREARVPHDLQLFEEVDFVHSVDMLGSVERALDRLLALASPPTALFAVNDQVAMCVQDALMARGMRSPENISIVGFDWFLRWLPSGGDLTTVAQPFQAIGEHATELLVQRIRDPKPRIPIHILLPASLVVKSTTRSIHRPAAT